MADWLGKENVVADAEAFAGIERDELAAIPDFDVFQNAQILTPAPLPLDTCLRKGFDIGQCAAVQNGQLEVVELDDNIVDLHAE